MKYKPVSLILAMVLAMSACTRPAPVEPRQPEVPVGVETIPYDPTPEQPTPEPAPIQPATTSAVLLDQGKNALFSGDFDLAIEKYSSALQNASQPGEAPAALLGLARVKIRMADCSAALQNINTIINEYSDSYERANAQYFLGECLSEDGNFAEAARAYARYLDFRPGLVDTLINEKSGDAWFSAGEYNQAIDAYSAAIPAAGTSAATRNKLKIAKSLKALGSYNEAATLLLELYESPASNDYDKAAANLLLGQMYLAIQEPDQAYARFKDSVEKFPMAYDAYTGLVILINDGVDVNSYHRGLVNYHAGQYGLAIDAFKREIDENPGHSAAPHHYMALSLRIIDQPEEAISQWEAVIADHNGDELWVNAWGEKAYTQWAFLNQFTPAAETLLSFVRLYPGDNLAPEFLFRVGRIYERNNDLSNAAAAWERVLSDYPSAGIGYRSLFLAGISYFRMGSYTPALTTFQRAQVLSTTPQDSAASAFWVGKTYQAQNNLETAANYWRQAAAMDATGYYSERAIDLINGRSQFYTPEFYDLAVDLSAERLQAEKWMRDTFSLGPEISLTGLGNFSADPRFLKANAYWELGLYDLASSEMESLRADLQEDPVETFLLIDQCLQLGLNRSAIFASRQVLNLAGLDDAKTLTDAPNYFNHIRFGLYFREYILEAARSENLHPLFLASVIRQESMFEGFVQSSAGARGIMQIMPATGEETAAMMAWPVNFKPDDLYRPAVSIKLGSHYLRRQIDLFDGSIAAGLTAYNGGPGNTVMWQSLAGDDPDILLEIIRFDETRSYIMQISDFLHIYNRIYERKP